MSKNIRDAKLRGIIKTFLVCNKGKKYSAKQISDFVNSANFAMNNTLVNANVVANLLMKGQYNPNHIFYDVKSETIYNRKYYYWED